MKILPKRTEEPVNGKGENVIRKEQHDPRLRRQPVVAVRRIQQPVKIQQKTVPVPVRKNDSVHRKKNEQIVNNEKATRAHKEETTCL